MESSPDIRSGRARRQQTAADANASGARLLLVDLELALTMLESAAVTRDSQTRLRNIENALRARDLVRHLRDQLELDEQQRRKVEERLAAIGQRLEELRRS